MRKIIVSIMLLLVLMAPVEAQISIPHVFTTTVPVSQLNTDFSTLGDGALKRDGGIIVGNIAVNSGITIDGVDLSAVLGGTGTPTFSTLTLSSTSASALDVAGGVNAGSGNVGIIDTSGRIPAISSTYFTSLAGANLTGLTAANVTVTPTTNSFSAGDYTAGGTMTWTVAAGDWAGYYYSSIGNLTFVQVYLTQTTVGGTLGPELRIDLPGSMTVSVNATGAMPYLDNGAAGVGVWVAGAGNSYLSLYKDGTTTTNWAAATDATQVRVTAFFYKS